MIILQTKVTLKVRRNKKKYNELKPRNLRTMRFMAVSISQTLSTLKHLSVKNKLKSQKHRNQKNKMQPHKESKQHQILSLKKDSYKFIVS